MNDFQNALFNIFGGRKYFYCSFWCVVTTLLLMTKHIQSGEWVLVIMWLFSNVLFFDNKESVAKINAVTPATQENINELK